MSKTTWTVHFVVAAMVWSVCVTVVGWDVGGGSAHAQVMGGIKFDGSSIGALQQSFDGGGRDRMISAGRARLRLTTEVVPQDMQLVLRFQIAGGEFFAGDGDQLQPVNTIATDKVSTNHSTRGAVQLEMAYLHWNLTPTFEVSAGIYDSFAHFPPNKYGDVGPGGNAGTIFEEKAFLNPSFLLTDPFTPDFVAISPIVLGVAGRYVGDALPVVVELGVNSTDASDLFNAGGRRARGSFTTLTPLTSTHAADDFVGGYLEVGLFPKILGGRQGGYRFGAGFVRWSKPAGSPGSEVGGALETSVDQFLSDHILFFGIYQRAEDVLANHAVTTVKENLFVGLGWSSAPDTFSAKDYLAVGWARNASFSNGVVSPFTGVPISGVVDHEHVIEAFWRHAYSDHLEISPDIQFVINPGGRDKSTLVLPALKVRAAF